jgi:hypothetical protein
MNLTSVLKFSFEITPGPLAPDDVCFCQGHIFISNGTTTISSEANGTMMLVASIPDLLNGVRIFLTDTSTSYQFHAIDSAFVMKFLKGRNGLISIKIHHGEINNISQLDLLTSLWTAVAQFLEHPDISDYMRRHDMDRIDVDDPSITTSEGFFYDLTNAIASFRMAFIN